MSGTRTTLRLRVLPGASRTGIAGRYGAAWKVRVTVAPEAGKANEAVLDLLARALDLRRRDVTLESGAGSRDKTVSLAGITLQAAESRLQAASEAAR